jgi:2-phospho-L-lactate/phosphoenolpyruvate guanylyltransferase
VSVQGTVASFDESEHHGSLLLDDGTRLPFRASAFEASGLRLLRVGQRVRVERSDAGDVTLVTLITMHQSVA